MAAAQYVLRIADRESLILSFEDLERHLSQIRTSDYSDLWLVRRGTSMKGFEKLLYRALGLRTESDGPSVYVVTSPAGAAVVFLDEDFNEQRVVNPASDRKGDIVFLLGNGQETRHRADEVVPHDVAFEAMRYFYEHGESPPSLIYRRSGKRTRRKATRR